MKAWYAIAAYSESFEEKDGVKVTPKYYETTHERKVVDDSKNLWDLVKNPNKYAVAIVGIVVLVLLILGFVIWRICRLIKKIKNKK